jgi:hypothetical protein
MALGTGEAVAVVEAPLMAAHTTNRELVIVGPEGADLEALRASLEATLPAGYSFSVRPAGEASASELRLDAPGRTRSAGLYRGFGLAEQDPV